MSSEEDDPSDDEGSLRNADLPLGGRRRFCNERKMGLPDTNSTHDSEESKSSEKEFLKHGTLGSSRFRRPGFTARPHPYHIAQFPTRRQNSGRSCRLKTADGLCTRKVYTNTSHPAIPSYELEDTVIYLNPAFVKKFAELSTRLKSPQQLESSERISPPTVDNARSTDRDSPSHNGATSINTFSKESIRAAATMAIIRLVTECIENDGHRDEHMNRSLVDQLVEKVNCIHMPSNKLTA